MIIEDVETSIQANFQKIIGQEHIQRTLEIAAAWGHIGFL
jgi:predicted ATPase with chaperone activity